ncbi:MAG: LuxR C-terminal-related transcriptional regulator, partial [Chloroflexota bacterium]|nr:LuxR C-terminal-related transcriptional regulator [Chloroflexota bacterium]
QVITSASPWLFGLLARCPRLTVLVTSRIALDIAGEQRLVVPPLPVPAAGEDVLERHAAVALFTQRAQAVDLSFHLNERNTGAVAEICRRLDGLPLAIELAAARVKVLSPDAILARLANRLTLLAGGRRDVPARLQSMRDAIGWSYELLSEPEKHLFRRLSVFTGGFTLDAAGYVVAWPDPPTLDDAVIDAIGGLVDQSLVQPIAGHADSRFLMLETIREYGLREVATRDQDDAVHLAHAGYYRQLAKQAQKELIGPNQAVWLDRLETEFANIRTAMAWLEERDRLDDAIELNAQIQFFLNIRGHSVESLHRLNAWLKLPDLAKPSRSRGLALLAAGGLRQNVGDTVSSAAMLVESAEILREAGDGWHASMALSILSSTYYQQGDLERMQAAAMESQQIARQVGNSRASSANLGHLSRVASLSGDHDLATDLQQRSFQAALEAGDRWLMAFRSAELAESELRSGDIDRAAHLALEAKNLFEELRSKRDLPGAWNQMAWIARKRGDLNMAAEYATTGLSIAEACGHAWSTAYGHLQRGVIAAEQGKLAPATEALSAAMTFFQARDQSIAIADCLAAFAMLAAGAGDGEHATRFLGASAARMRQAGIDREQWDPDLPSPRVTASLRTSLGEERFERLQAEGAAFTIDEAVSEALAYTIPASRALDAPAPDHVARQHGLTPRELEVLRLMADGLSNQRIADALFLSPRTVTTHITGILGKLDLSSRTAAVSFAIRSGIA